MKEQSGICPDANQHALFLCLNRSKPVPSLEPIQRSVHELPKTLDNQANEYKDARLSGVVAIGAAFWDEYCPDARPAELAPFPVLDSEQHVVPHTPFDLLLHIRSDRRDVNYIVGQKFIESLAGTAEVAEEVHGFRYLDSRDLTGFVDGTENPQGEHRRKVALVDTEDAAFAGGSYLHIQRYIHNLNAWNELEVKSQEDIIGRTKVDNVEYKSADKAPTAHIKRAALKDPDGESIEILRHSMPYGNTTESGLLFISYARTPKNFTLMLESMFKGDEQGNYDRLMDYTCAVTGAAFFAPSRDFLSSHT